MRSKAIKLVVAVAPIVAAAIWTAGVASQPKPVPVAAPLVVNRAYETVTDTVRRNETLSHIFGRHEIRGAELVDVVRAARGLDPRRIRPNQVFEFRYAINETKPDRIKVRVGDDNMLTVARDTGGTWTGFAEAIFWTVEVRKVHGVINSSLYEAMDESIPDSILSTEQRAYMVDDLDDDVFGWVIDFFRDFYKGDEFTVVYERLVSQLGDVRYGRVLAARIETRGNVNNAYVMTDERGRNEYFDDHGRSLRRSFKIRPVELGRLSSRFSKRRFHPILKTYRPHHGIDYAASTGTPIKATAGGVVTRAGRWGTYGIMVSIKHPKGIETRYGHMSRVADGIKPGTRIEQEQVIGYVGMTGLASAPHVHYEILLNGTHRDPRDLLEKEPGRPVPADLRDRYDAIVAQYNALLDARSTLASAAYEY
ncbi:MAG: M23 family metallopeptidase [Gammaproteobacteria bacterium]|jgi:murein DD-endopeptidase MepM/ murein hydrolase activator NlpD